MKKGNLFGKRMVVMATLVAALSAAVFINYKFTSVDGAMDISGMLSKTQYLGDAQFVNEMVTNAKKEKIDYFSKTRKDREESRNKSMASLKEIIDDVKASDEAKSKASEQIAWLAQKSEDESSVEALICSKGFEDCVAVITDEGINIIVKSPEKGLLESETMQIQDIITNSFKISLENIKIIEVK